MQPSQMREREGHSCPLQGDVYPTKQQLTEKLKNYINGCCMTISTLHLNGCNSSPVERRPTWAKSESVIRTICGGPCKELGSTRLCWHQAHPRVHWGISCATWAFRVASHRCEFFLEGPSVKGEARNVWCASMALLCNHVIKKKKCWWLSVTRLFFRCGCQQANMSAPGFSG